MKRDKDFVGRKQMQRIEDIAHDDLSNYDGYENDYESDYEDDYDGSGDDFLDFDGGTSDIASFRKEASNGRTFQMTFSNTTPKEGQPLKKTSFYVVPGFKNFDASGHRPNGVAREGTFVSIEGENVIGKGAQDSIDNFQRFVYANPCRITGFRLSATGANNVGPQQLEEMRINIEQQSIFRPLGSKEIIPAMYLNENTFRNNLVTVPEQMQLDNQTAVLVTLEPGATLTLTFIIGGTINTAIALDRKAKRAKKNLRQA